MMGAYEAWRKEVEGKIAKFISDEKMKENIPAELKRCPRCLELSLEFDVKKGKIKCSKCGFEEDIPVEQW